MWYNEVTGLLGGGGLRGDFGFCRIHTALSPHLSPSPHIAFGCLASAQVTGCSDTFATVDFIARAKRERR
jgi:hypothetical protein